MNEPARSTAPRSTVLVALVVDLVLVVVFAIIGRSSHAEALEPAGIWQTAWPFLVGLAVGWAIVRAWRRPLAIWPSGVVIWVVTVAGGMALRALSGQGTALPFIIVATITLALFLLGWRAIALLVQRVRRRAEPTAS